MAGSFLPMLDSRTDLIEQARKVREDFRKLGPRVRARDIALAIYDSCRFSADLTRLLVIDAITAVARQIVANERALGVGGRAHAGAGAGAGFTFTDQPEFPEFADICRECPSNYALPGDTPDDMIYVETLDEDFASLPAGSHYLRRHAQTELRHATGLDNLFALCRRLGGKPGETPREIFKRHGFAI